MPTTSGGSSIGVSGGRGSASFDGLALQQTIVIMKDWLYTFSLPTQQRLERHLHTLKDRRRKQQQQQQPMKKQLTPSLLGTYYANNAPVAAPAKEQAPSDAADEKKKVNIFTDPVLLRNDVQELVQFTVNHLFVTLLSNLLVDDKEQQLMKALPPMNGVSTGKRVEIVENNETY